MSSSSPSSGSPNKKVSFPSPMSAGVRSKRSSTTGSMDGRHHLRESLVIRQIQDMSKVQQELAIVMGALPPLFELVQVSDGELELCPGIRLASAARIPRGVQLPLGVVYCYVSPIAPMINGIKRLPYHLIDQCPVIKGCELLMIPPVLQLMEGVNLIQGAAMPPNIVLPPNVTIVQRDAIAAATKRLPKGLKEVHLSTIFKAPPSFKLPSLTNYLEVKRSEEMHAINDGSSLVLVQMHTAVALPVGVEVSPGCEIAPNPDEAMLPHGVQIVRCHDDCQVFPSFMTPLQLLAINDKLITESSSSSSASKDNHTFTPSHQSDYTMSSRDIDVEMDLHRQMLEGCIVLQKPTGFKYGPGVEFIARPANLRPCMIAGTGIRPLTLEEYPPGLTPSDLTAWAHQGLSPLYLSNQINPSGLSSPTTTEDQPVMQTWTSAIAAAITTANAAAVEDETLTGPRWVLELIQLPPRFDFPEGTSPFPGWQFFTRPVDLRLPVNTHLVRHTDAAGGAAAGKPLPPYVHEVHVPDKLPPPPHLPTGTHFTGSTLPAGCTACEFLPGTCFPLPAGTIMPVGVDEKNGTDDVNDDSSLGSLTSLNSPHPDSPTPKSHPSDDRHIRPGFIRVISPLTVAAMMSDEASSSSDQDLTSLRYKFERLLTRALPLNACLCTYDDDPHESQKLAPPLLGSLPSMTSMMSEETSDDTTSGRQSMTASAFLSFQSNPFESTNDMTNVAVRSEGMDGKTISENRVHFDETKESGESERSDENGIDRPHPPPQSLVFPFGVDLIDQLIVDHGSDGVPETLTLPKDVFAVTLPVRFELPLGAKLAPGVILGSGVQLSPGTILSRSLEVLEWPAGFPLPAGHELVRLLPEHHCLPMGTCVSKSVEINTVVTEFLARAKANNITMPFPPGHIIIDLTRDGLMRLTSAAVLAEQVEVISLDEFIGGLEEVLEKQREARDEMFAEQAQAHVSQHNAASIRASDKVLSGSDETYTNNNISNSSSHGSNVIPLDLDNASSDHHQGGVPPQESPDSRPRSRGTGVMKAKTIYRKGMVMMDEDLRAQLTVLCDDVVKAMKSKIVRFLPPGTALVRRKYTYTPFPSNMHVLPRTALPAILHRILKLESQWAQADALSHMAPLERIAYMDHNKELVVPEWEVVQVEPKYALPEGTELAPGVVVLPRPHWLDLQTPFWVELVTKIPDPDSGPSALAALRQTLTGYSAPSDQEVQRAVEVCRKLRAMRLPLPIVTSGREVMYPHATFQTQVVGDSTDIHNKDGVEKTATAVGSGDLNDWLTAGFGLPSGCELILVSDTLELYSLGKGAPGFETLVRPSPVMPAGLTTTATIRHSLMPLLPRAHFLIQRPRKHAPPVSLKMGYSPEYENLVGHFLLPPGGEVVHLRSQFVLPYGVILHGNNMALAPCRIPSADEWKESMGGLMMGLGRRMSGGFKGGLSSSGKRNRRITADVKDVYDGSLTARRTARRSMDGSDKEKLGNVPLLEDIPFPIACTAVSESLCLNVGQLISPGVTILPHPTRYISDWLPFVLDELKPVYNDGVTVSAPFAFVRMSDPTIGLDRTLGDTHILQNSDTIVNLAYRDETIELTSQERGELALRVCDVIKVVALPSKIPRLREILRLDVLAEKEKARQAMAIPKGATLTSSGKVAVEGVVHPFLQLMGGNKSHEPTNTNTNTVAFDKYRDGEIGFNLSTGLEIEDGRGDRGQRHAKHKKTGEDHHHHHGHHHHHHHPSPKKKDRHRRDAMEEDVDGKDHHGMVPPAIAGSSPPKHKHESHGHSRQSSPPRATSPDVSVSTHPPNRSSPHTSPPPHPHETTEDLPHPHLPKIFPPTNTTKTDRAIIAQLMRSASTALDSYPRSSPSPAHPAVHNGGIQRRKPPERRYSFGGSSSVHSAADAARILVNTNIAMGGGVGVEDRGTESGNIDVGGNNEDHLSAFHSSPTKGVGEDRPITPSLLQINASIAAHRADSEFVSLVNNLPMSESLIISLAAAERRIVDLEKENNQYRFQMGEIMKEKDNQEVHINVLNTKIARLAAEKDALKKAAKDLKYAHVLEGKQVDLRMKEFDQVKVLYEQYQKKTEPLIASLTAKVKTMEILAAAEQSELDRKVAEAVKNATDELILREVRIVAAAREAVTLLSTKHTALTSHLTTALGRLSLSIVGEAVRRYQAVGSVRNQNLELLIANHTGAPSSSSSASDSRAMKHASHGSYGRLDALSGGYGLKTESTGGNAGEDSGNDDNGSLDDHSMLSSWYPPHQATAESSSPMQKDQGSIATALALTATTEEARRASLSSPAQAKDVTTRVRDSLPPSDSLPPTREEDTRLKGLGSSQASNKETITHALDIDDESLASLNSKGLQSLADSVSSTPHIGSPGRGIDSKHHHADDDDSQQLPTFGKKAVLHPHSQPSSRPGSRASASHSNNDHHAPIHADAPMSSQESTTSTSGGYFSANAPFAENKSTSPHRQPFGTRGSNPTRATSDTGHAQPSMPNLYLADSSFTLPFRVTLPHGGLRPLGQPAAAYEAEKMEAASVAIHRWVDAEGLSTLVSSEVNDDTTEATLLIEHALNPPAVQAPEEEPPGSPASGLRKPLLNLHNPVTPQSGKRGSERMSLKKGNDTLQLVSPRRKPSKAPGSPPGESLTTHIHSLESSKTPFASVSPHSASSFIAPNPPSRYRRKGHMEVIEKRITDLVDQISRLHRDVSQTEQHRYERALNMAEREADVLAHSARLADYKTDVAQGLLRSLAIHLSSNGSVNGGASETGNSGGGMVAPGGSLQQQSVYSYQSMPSQSQSLQSQSVATHGHSKAAFNGEVNSLAGSALDAVSLSSIRSLGRVQNNQSNMNQKENRNKGGGSTTRYPQHNYHHHQLYNHLDQQHQHPHHGASSSSSLSSVHHPQVAAIISQSQMGGITPPPLSASDTYHLPQPANSSHSLSGLDSLDGGGSHSSDDMEAGQGLGRTQGPGLHHEGYLMNHGIAETEGDVGSLEESSHWDDLLGEGNDGDSYTLGNDGGGSSSQYLPGQHGEQGLGMMQGMGGSMSHHGLQRVPYHESGDVMAVSEVPHSHADAVDLVVMLRAQVERLRFQVVQPTLIRLQNSAGALADLKQVQSALQWYALSLRQQATEMMLLADRSGDDDAANGTGSHVKPKKSVTSNDILTTANDETKGETKGEMDEGSTSSVHLTLTVMERKALRHRATVVLRKAAQFDRRAKSVHVEVSNLRLDITRELQAYESAAEPALLAETLQTMRSWAKTSQQGVTHGPTPLGGSLSSSSSSSLRSSFEPGQAQGLGLGAMPMSPSFAALYGQLSHQSVRTQGNVDHAARLLMKTPKARRMRNKLAPLLAPESSPSVPHGKAELRRELLQHASVTAASLLSTDVSPSLDGHAHLLVGWDRFKHKATYRGIDGVGASMGTKRAEAVVKSRQDRLDALEVAVLGLTPGQPQGQNNTGIRLPESPDRIMHHSLNPTITPQNRAGHDIRLKRLEQDTFQVVSRQIYNTEANNNKSLNASHSSSSHSSADYYPGGHKR